jgi:hypothetical protein
VRILIFSRLGEQYTQAGIACNQHVLPLSTATPASWHSAKVTDHAAMQARNRGEKMPISGRQSAE